jgi:hypothetical protein
MIVFNRNRGLDFGQRMAMWIVNLCDDNDVTANGEGRAKQPDRRLSGIGPSRRYWRKAFPRIAKQTLRKDEH